MWGFHLTELEAECFYDMLLLDRALTLKEQRRLRIVIEEPPSTQPDFSVKRFGRTHESPLLRSRLARGTLVERTRLVGHAAGVDRMPHMAVSLQVMHRALWPVDWNLIEVRSTQTAQLGVQVREQPPLQQWIRGEVDSGNDVPRMKGDLFGLRKEIVWIAIQYEPSDWHHGHHLLGYEL